MTFHFVLSLLAFTSMSATEDQVSKPDHVRLLDNLESTEVKSYTQEDGGVLWLFTPKPTEEVQAPTPILAIETLRGRIEAVARPAIWLNGQYSTYLRSAAYPSNFERYEREKKYIGLNRAGNSFAPQKVLSDFLSGYHSTANRHILSLEGLIAIGPPKVEVVNAETLVLQNLIAKLKDLECKLNCALDRLSKLEGEQAARPQTEINSLQPVKEPVNLLNPDVAPVWSRSD